MRTLWVFSVAFSAVFSFASSLHAQNGTISGTVRDTGQGVIPKAKVKLFNEAAGINRSTESNASGVYSFPAVAPGVYDLSVISDGFQSQSRTGIVLNVASSVQMDFVLSVGNVETVVNVAGDAPIVNATDASVGTVVDREFVENLPLNGRSFQTLIMLTPGVVIAQTAYDDQGQFSVNGQRADANYFTVDGVSANFGVTGYSPLVQAAGGALPALGAQGGTNTLVSVEAMQEFRVQTSSFAPEFGRMPGGQISIVTRSGTNQFHGTLFEYFRNDLLDANDWFSNFNHLPKPAERQSDFGGVFGGPILKNKTFFFFSYEGLRLRQPATQETVVPDMASRQQAPTAIQPYLNAYPVPNGPELGSGTAQSNGSYSSPSSLDAYSIRMDHALNSKLSLFGRYNYSPSDITARDPFGALSSTQSFGSSVQTFTLGLTHVITPGISNEVRANYSNHRLKSKYELDNFGGAVPVRDSALFPSGFSSANGSFEYDILGVGAWITGKSATDEQRQLNLIDNLSWSRGRHQLKFGVDYRWLSPFTSRVAYGEFAAFTGVTTGAGGTLSGTAAASTVSTAQTATFLTPNYSFYGQDTWNLSPLLTLTYGLRWDINPALKGKNFSSEPFTVTGLNNPATMTLAPRGTPLYDTTYGNVAPRVGVAYQLSRTPDWGTVLRGGFGVFYDLGYGSLGAASSYWPFQAVKTITPSTCPSGIIGVCFPLGSQQAAPPALSTNPPVNVIVTADPNLKLPRTYQWNVAVEQALGKHQALSLTYVGAIGRDLLRVSNLYNPNPAFQFVSVTSNTATSDYHALQVKFQRRLSHGLQALASYSFSHSIDIASTDAAATYLNTPSFIDNPTIDRGNSDFDIRHSFTTGVTYGLPTAGWSKFGKATLGGWSIDAYLFARSAPPVNVIGGNLFLAGTALRYRPNLLPGQPLELLGSGYAGGKIFNKAAFTAAPNGQQGDFGRNVMRGFEATQTDVAFQRQFAFTEKLNLRFRTEFFNIFNHANFGSPLGDLTSLLFGRSTQTLASSLAGQYGAGFNPLYQVGGPRSVQLALKLVF